MLGRLTFRYALYCFECWRVRVRFGCDLGGISSTFCVCLEPVIQKCVRRCLDILPSSALQQLTGASNKRINPRCRQCPQSSRVNTDSKQRSGTATIASSPPTTTTVGHIQVAELLLKPTLPIYGGGREYRQPPHGADHLFVNLVPRSYLHGRFEADGVHSKG